MVNMDYYPEMAQDWARAQEFVSEEYPWMANRVSMSMRRSQLTSKLWLADELSKIQVGFESVGVMGGWFCQYLTELLITNLEADSVMNYDIDPDAIKISRFFNKRFERLGMYSATVRDPFLEKMKEHDLIVNTSCEHMYPMKKIKKDGPLYVLQSSNNKQYKDHINCVDSEFELADQAGIKDPLFMGVIELKEGSNRYMVIGR